MRTRSASKRTSRRNAVLARAADASHGQIQKLENRVLLSGTSGPILDFRFDQTPTFGFQTVTDSSGTTAGTFYGTNNGSLDITNNGFPTVVTGATSNTGTAWNFPANPTVTQAEIDVPNQGAIQSMGSTATQTGLTLGFWVNDAYQTSQSGMTLMNSGVLDVAATTVNSVGQLKITLGNTQITATTSLTGGVLNGSWHHVVLTADFTSASNNVHLYVDGTLDPTNGTQSHSFTNFSNTYTSGNDLWIFSDKNRANHWVGSADDVVIYNRAITQAEVSELYQHGSDAAPNVFAGQPQNIDVNVPTALNGAVYNEGNVAHTTDINTWSQISGPGTVKFANASLTNTTATFPATGTYVLQLSSTDGLYTATSTVTETVATNLAPVVTTTSTMPAVVLPTASLGIGGTVTDDGLPYGTLKTTWSLLTAPASGGTVSFANAHAVNTTATFSAAGRYVLQLTASDGSLSSSSQLSIEVYPAGTGGNQIVVDAGGTHEAWMDSPTVNLSGSYWNTNNAVTASWSVVESPSGGTVSFGNATSLATTATFNEAGTYTLQLHVTDGTISGSGTCVVQVYSTAQNFSDPLGFLNQYFNTNSNLDLSYDFTGFDWSNFSSPGAAYSHPRILMSASDIPGLVSRLQNTNAGKIEFATIDNSVANNLTNSTATYASIYSDLSNGIATSFVSAGRPYALVAALSYDAFEQMILYAEATNGSAAQAAALAEGQKIGAALATVSNDSYAQISLDNNADWQNANINYTYRDQLAFAYDYDYNFMTSSQQNSVRNAIINAINGQWSIGEETLPSYQSNSSNWIPMIDSALLMNICAVEGETSTDPGGGTHVPDPTNYPRVEAALQKWFALGMFSDGEMYEGMGKGQLYAQSLVALAKRGDYLIAATSARYNIQQLYSASMEPYGYSYTWDEYLGGSDMPAKDADTEVLAYAFPNDSAIDFQLRNALGADYSNVNLGSGLPNLGFGVTSDQLLIEATLVTDYNTSQTYAQAQAAAGAETGLIYTSNDRGLLIARSDNTTNASQLYFQPRVEPGGHSVPDRNAFTYAALGENWVPYTGVQSNPQHASVVTVDGNGPSTMPAAVTNLTQTSNAVFMTGNATQAYSTGNGSTSTPAQWNYNEFQLTPSDPAWGNLPVSQLPFWDTNGQQSGVTWTQGTQYIAAFRTAGLIRGTDPYALITDNIQEDQNTHTYTWQMAINDNVTWTIDPPTSGNPFYDVILTDPGTGSHLLVRMLGYSGTTPTIAVSPTQTDAFTFDYKMLTFSTTSVAPNFKAMLYAFNSGTPLPTTTWNSNNSVLTIQAADGQTDQITYNTANPNNPTSMTLNRLSSGGSAYTAPGVTIAATNPNANANNGMAGTFTVTRTGSTTNALTVSYTVSGSAIAGTNYTALSGTVTIPAGASSATISVAPLTTSSFVTAATVTVNLSPNPAYAVASTSAATGSAATVTIAGNHVPTSSAMGSLTGADIGSPAGAGSSTLSGQTFTVKGGGQGLGIASGSTSSDQFQFDSQALSGDGYIIARIDTENGGSSPKAGVMFRDTTNGAADAAAPFIYLGSDSGGTVRLIYRATESATTSNPNSVSLNAPGSSSPCWVKLVRSGNLFTAYYSLDGAGWMALGSQTIAISSSANVGLVSTAGNSTAASTTLNTATFDEVSINGNGVNASPTVTITAPYNATEGSPAVGGEFVVQRDNALGDLVVNYAISGTATGGTDYSALPGTVIIPDGQSTAVIPVTPIGTASAGSSKTVILTFASGTTSTYTIGSTKTATVTITEAGTKTAGLAPVIWYSMDQTPNRNANGITDNTGNTTGTISSGTGTPTVVAGATAGTSPTASTGAWNFGTTAAGITVSGTSTNNWLNSLGNINRTTGLTIGFWENLNYSSSMNWNTIMSFGKVFDVQVSNDTTNHSYIIFTVGPQQERTSNTLDGTWHYIVMSADFTASTENMTVFVDGHQDLNAEWLYNPFTNFTLPFNDSINDPSNPSLTIGSTYQGSLDDVMVFNRPLNTQQVQTLYTESDHPVATVSVGTPPITGSVSSATITFDRSIEGLTTSNLTLTRDGANVPLTGVTISPGSTTYTGSYTVSGLGSLTTAQGSYVLTLASSTSIIDQNSVALVQSASAGWVYYTVPSNVQATAPNPNDVHLTWTNTQTAGTSPQIDIQRSLDGSTNWQTVATIAGSSTSYDDTTAADGTQYFYRLDDSSNGNTSAHTGAVSVATPLLAPTIFSAAQVPNVIAAQLTWIDNSADATSITISRSSNNGATWQQLTTFPNGTAAQYTDKGVISGGTYLYRIQAGNAVATSSYVTSTAVTISQPTAPTIASAASAPALVTTASATLSVLGADAGGAGNLTYTWATTGTPPAAVNFSDNGDNTAQTTTANFSAPGTYNFTVTITNQAGLSVTSSVSTTVVSALAGITVSPASPTIAPASTMQFSAMGYDQFNRLLATQPFFNWSVAGGSGGIDRTGFFTAPPSGGTTTVQASSGAVTGTATVTISAPLGIFTNDSDIGSPSPAGSASYNTSSGNYSVTGGGADIFNTSDQFNYLYKSFTGPGTIVAEVTGTQNTNAWMKAGIMFRNSASASDTFADVVVSYSQGAVMQYRTASGGSAGSGGSNTAGAPTWIELVRGGTSANGYDQFSGYYYAGSTEPTSQSQWIQLGGTITIPNFSSTALVGLCVTSHSNGTAATGTITNVQITGATGSVAQAPVVAVGAAAVSSSISAGGTDNLSVLGIDNGGNSGLTYTWTATPASGVSFSTNGTNAAANTTATFTQPGLVNLLVTIKNASGLTTTSSVNVNVLPAWLSPASLAIWNGANQSLDVSGATTIDADPGSPEPIVYASGPSASLAIDPASGTAVHLGGLRLTNQATATVTSLGSARSLTNYHLLVIGTPGATTTPTFTIDPTSTLNLADNDMAILYGTGATPLPQVQEDIQNGYDGGAWNGTGIKSSAAATLGGATGLGYAEESELSAISEAAGGSAITTFDGQSLGSNAVLLKYTLLGDSTLSGTVSGTDYNTVLANYDSTGDWSQGNFHYGGTYTSGTFTDDDVAGQDYNAVLNNYDNSLASYLPAGAAPAAAPAKLVASPAAATSASAASNKGKNSTPSVAPSPAVVHTPAKHRTRKSKDPSGSV